jgi:hypothetical protein
MAAPRRRDRVCTSRGGEGAVAATQLTVKPINFSAYAPIVAFTSVYASTCLVGALLLMADFRPYAALFEYFSGFTAPKRPEVMPLQLALLLVAPIVMWLGYALGIRARLPSVLTDLSISKSSRLTVPPWLPHVVFYVLAAFALMSLTAGSSSPDWRTWFDPQAVIDARYEVFRAIPFAGFVNIYTLVPLAAAWIVVGTRGSTFPSLILRWLPVLVAVALSLLLYQKRPALNVLILVCSATIIMLQRTNPRRAWLAIVGGLGGLMLVYLGLVMIPAYFESNVALSEARPAPTVNPEYPVTPEIGAQPPATSAPAVITEGGKTPSVLLYALLGPLNRTSVSALYYPVVFPDVHGFYGLDVGQDMLGKLPGFTVNRMPDDNIVVWDYMAPAMPGGRVAAPFQFVLYSQVGLLGALAGSLIAGVLLALAWRGVQDRRVPTVWASLAGALVLLLSVFLAMDSARNSLLVSYGVFWGFLFIGAAMTMSRLFMNFRRRGWSRSVV